MKLLCTIWEKIKLSVSKNVCVCESYSKCINLKKKKTYFNSIKQTFCKNL